MCSHFLLCLTQGFVRAETVLYSLYLQQREEGLFVETITQPDPKGYLPSSVVFAGVKAVCRKQLVLARAHLTKE